jgi:hypothetical protein
MRPAAKSPLCALWQKSIRNAPQWYRLQPAEKVKPFSLLAGDASLLFFVDDNNRPLVGNEDFSFTLNRVDR